MSLLRYVAISILTPQTPTTSSSSAEVDTCLDIWNKTCVPAYEIRVSDQRTVGKRTVDWSTDGRLEKQTIGKRTVRRGNCGLRVLSSRGRLIKKSSVDQSINEVAHEIFV